MSLQRTILASALLFVLFANYAFAHTYLSGLFLNGQALNEGDCVRPHPPQDKEYPILKVTDADMTCGWLPYAANPANRKCPVAAGSQIGMQWWHNYPGDDVLSTTHKGPISVYLAKSENGLGNVWFKIYEDGYNAATGQWATDKLIANRGRLDFTLPADIAPGNYLMRGELFALHNAYSADGIQPYIGCAELTISGSGSATPQGVAFPGYYTNTSPGMMFNIYQSYNSYTIPGPALYIPSTVQSTSTGAPATAAPTTRPAAPTNAPVVTSPPVAATTRPTTPTSAPYPSYSTMTFALNQGSNEWWVGIALSGYSETVVQVAIMDGHALTSWTPCTDMGYAYVFGQSVQMTLPVSLRITSSKGHQIILNNAITSWSVNVIDTHTNFPSSS